MNKNISRKLKKAAVLAMISASALTLSGCTIGNTKVVLDTNSLSAFGGVFSINGEKCSKAEAKVYLANYKNLYDTSFGIDLSDFQSEDISVDDYVRKVALEELARIYCMDQMAEEREITLDDEEESAVKEAAAAYYDTLCEAELQYMDVTEEKLEEYYTHYALAEKLYNTMLSQEDIEISEDEARVMKALVIFISDSEKATAAADELAGGTDFETVASEYSELSKTDVTVNRDTYSEEINDVIYGMDDDQVSDPIQTSDGTWFFKIVNKYVEDLTEARQAQLQEEARTKDFREAYDAFEKDSLYYLNESEWNDISLEDAAEVSTKDFFAIYDQNGKVDSIQ